MQPAHKALRLPPGLGPVGQRGIIPQVEFRDPPLAQRLFGTPGFGWLWLPVRVYLGYKWLQAGLMPEPYSGRGRWVDCPPAQVNGRRGDVV